ncbi:MAG: translation initiation factor IF-2 N-terminal domain-containing protein, partial [Deltaproteobacteria bacterium]|nr:translation initiation factor IF-2 N-terminal domain-containing protein [Deltaproteobacteria bacterium]
MAKIRIYELARDLNMTNKVLLEKLNELDLDIKSHMSSLEEETVARIKNRLLDKEAEGIEITRVKPGIIRRRKKVVKPVPIILETVSEAETLTEKVAADERQPQEAPEKLAAEKAPEIIPPEEVPAETPPQDAPHRKKGKKIPAKDAGEDVKPTAKDLGEPKLKKATLKKEAEEKETPAKKTVKPSTVKKLKPAKKTKKTKKETPAKIIKLPIPPPEIPPEKSEEPIKKPVTKGKKIMVVDKVEMKLEPGEEELSPAEKKKLSRKKLGEPLKDKKFFKKKISFRSKEVVEGEDLYAGDKSRIKKGRKAAKAKAAKGQKPQITIPKAIKRRVKIDDTIILSDLAKRMGIKANQMLKQLMTLGVMATVNQTIDFDTATLV